MPRQRRHLPLGITRFNYWDYTRIAPRPSSPAGVPDPETDLGAVAHDRMRSRFLAHRDGRACGERRCLVEQAIKRDPSQRPFLALSDYVETDWLWQQDPEAQRVVKGLTRTQLKKIGELHRRMSRRKRRAWGTLIQEIERDQAVFRALILDEGLRRVVNRRDLEGSIVIARHRMSVGQAKRIWSEYHRQGLKLLGQPVPLGGLSPKGRGKRRDASAVIEAINKRLPKDQAVWKAEPVRREDGTVEQVLKRITEPRPRLTAKSRMKVGPAACGDWEEVLDWLGLALKNLKRLRSGRPPLTWSPKPEPRPPF